MADQVVDFQEYNQLSQKVAEAIEAVLGIDVTIMNEDMCRIGGTGLYSQSVGERIELNTVFDWCLKKGAYYIVKETKQSEICYDCPRLKYCLEKAEICVPIKHGEETVGVIGIIASTDIQRESIFAHEASYLNFLMKMSSLLEAKYREIVIAQENRLLEKRIGLIINNVSEGLILFDDHGKALFWNQTLDKLICEEEITDQEGFVQSIHAQLRLPQQDLCEADCGPGEIFVSHRGKQFSFLASISPLKMFEGRNEYVVLLQNLKKIQKQVIQSAAKNQVQISFGNIIGASRKMTSLKEYADQAAQSDSSVLITGESGTGKELFARAIHNRSTRGKQPFVAINCGAIPDELLESELFGYEKGAFTGAHSTKYGKFEVANHGTIFLDEIGELPFHLQVKLLRVLQEREICRIGSNEVRKINIRVIAATNAELSTQISNGVFRKDLYYRLNIIPLQIPPLRERPEDILCIAKYFLCHYNQLLGKDIEGFSKEASKALLKYPWPGNVRELQNVVEYAVNFETAPFVRKECLEKRLNIGDSGFGSFLCAEGTGTMGVSLDSCLKGVEKKVLMGRIDKYHAHPELVQMICRDLVISKATLYRKLKEHQLRLSDETDSEMRQPPI